jgi:hypothetical protein
MDEEKKDIMQQKTVNMDVSPGMNPEQILDAVLKKEEIIPWEDAQLPSKGVYYKGEEGKDLIPDGMVKVRAMGIFADKILATARLHTGFKALDWLFRKCVRFPECAGRFDPLDLLNGDRMFLLYYLRGITHGPAYEFIVRCTNPDCGLQSKLEYDLTDLFRTVMPSKLELGPEPFKVVLPFLSKSVGSEFWVKVRLLRGRDVTAMLTKRSFNKVTRPRPVRPRNEAPMEEVASESLDDTVSQNLSLVIVEAMGSRDRIKIEQLVEKMHSDDTATIREFLKDASPGIEFQLTVTCQHCDTEMTMDLPITETFFRPTKRRGAG